VLDAGAGSGRATLACLRAGASRIYAVEPSPGLLRLLRRTLDVEPLGTRVTPLRGRFAALPLADNSVRVTLSCSAFTAAPEQGGERGLAELRRVTQPGGLIVIIWPRPRDFTWLAAAGFRYVALPIPPEMSVRYHSRASALRVARRFYARNAAVLEYLQERSTCEVPYTLLGANPPHDYCWLRTEK
jgi:ubiquinone/menaquinone biosynthesis C-methylase UbiE